MFKKTPLDLEIDRIVALIGELDPLSKDGRKAVEYLAKLEDVKARRKPKFNISGDAILAASVTVLTTVLILYREELHPVNSKALGFIPKPKI